MKEHGTALINRPVVRIVLIWIIEAFGLLIMDRLQNGMDIETPSAAIATVAVIGLLNALLWPILSRILLPFAVFTAGLFFLVLNGFIVWLAGQILPGFTVDSLGTAVITSLGLTAINVIFSTLLTIDDDASYYRNVINKRMRRSKEVVETGVPGVFFLEIDGLARPVLEKAMALGYTPTIKRWLEEGSHTLVGWETDLSSQTSASQAGLLHGNNFNIPAFRWYDRERRKIVASSDMDEVAKLEKDHSRRQRPPGRQRRQPGQLALRRRTLRHEHGQHPEGFLPVSHRRFLRLLRRPLQLLAHLVAVHLGHCAGAVSFRAAAAARYPASPG